MSTIELKTVGDVLAQKYVIPEYQRGYRWGKEQVEDLLNDLYEFHKNKGPNEFYCLQPIVVKKRDDNKYIVIDGQQRLTTLKMIVCYLEAPKESKEKVVFKEILHEVEYKDKERKEGKSKIDDFFKNYAWFNIREFKYKDKVDEKSWRKCTSTLRSSGSCMSAIG